MTRRALIIYCDNTGEELLEGPYYDNQNFVSFLTSPLGGDWYNSEIKSLHNPKVSDVKASISGFMSGADYTLILYSGHGATERNSNLQLLELSNGNISILDLRTIAPKQLMIFDTCREYPEVKNEDMVKLAKMLEEMNANRKSTRELFNLCLSKSGDGLSVMYSSSLNQASLDSKEGGYYLLSLLGVAKEWEKNNNQDQCLDIREAHIASINYMKLNFPTIQKPEMAGEKRNVYFPFAVKHNWFSKLL